MSENYDAAVAVQKREAAEASITRINALHGQCCAADADINRLLLGKINHARECGLELIQYGKANKGAFKASFGKKAGASSCPFSFEYGTAKIYMRFARAHPAPITLLADGIRCLKDALIASGSLAAPNGHGPQKLHTFDFAGAITKHAFDFKSLWGTQLKREPIEKWTDDRKEIVRDELEWFARTYVQLGGKL